MQTQLLSSMFDFFGMIKNLCYHSVDYEWRLSIRKKLSFVCEIELGNTHSCAVTISTRKHIFIIINLLKRIIADCCKHCLRAKLINQSVCFVLKHLPNNEYYKTLFNQKGASGNAFLTKRKLGAIQNFWVM